MKPRKYGWTDKAAPYKAWRYNWDHGAVHDVDQVEWRDGQPLAVLELTSADEITDEVKDSVAYRLWHQFSGRKLRYLAQRMRVPFYIVLFTPAVDQLSVCGPLEGGCAMGRLHAVAVSVVVVVAASAVWWYRRRRYDDQPLGIA